eukprot:g14989.t1
MTAAEDSPIEGGPAATKPSTVGTSGETSGSPAEANSSDPADASSVVSGTAPAATEASAQPDGVSVAGVADATPAEELRSQMGTSQPSGRVHPTLPVPLAAAALSETVTHVQPPIPCPVNFGHSAVWDSPPRDVQASFVADSAQPPIPCPAHFGHPAFWDSLPREVQAAIASDAGRADACVSARLTLAEETARLRREEDLRMQIQLQTLHRRSADITARLASLTREEDDDRRAEQELMQRRATEDAARAALQQQRTEAIALTRSDLAAIASATAEATLERDSVLSSRASSAASSPRIRAVSSGTALGADPPSFPASAPSQPVLAASAPAPSQPVSAASAPASSQPVSAASAPVPSQPVLAASVAAPSAPVAIQASLQPPSWSAVASFSPKTRSTSAPPVCPRPLVGEPTAADRARGTSRAKRLLRAGDGQFIKVNLHNLLRHRPKAYSDAHFMKVMARVTALVSALGAANSGLTLEQVVTTPRDLSHSTTVLVDELLVALRVAHAGHPNIRRPANDEVPWADETALSSAMPPPPAQQAQAASTAAGRGGGTAGSSGGGGRNNSRRPADRFASEDGSSSSSSATKPDNVLLRL